MLPGRHGVCLDKCEGGADDLGCQQKVCQAADETRARGMCLQVLFCSLTGDQRDLYRAYLSSEEVQDILNVRSCNLGR